MFDAYDRIQEEYLGDIDSRGILLRHKKTGARVALLSNDDNNKVFNIAFRTPPADSTGAAHIIEHSVLCGSEKYPLKDPFLELAKGSLNTFLNAMTFPDKTMYPVASCNDRDFRILMDVYLDAVFHPMIYHNENIFRKEGWHYALEDPEGELTCNGVVLNEMKGAFSEAEEVLDRNIFSSLFPDTPYGVESGGDPEHIPDLTYERFLDFHRSYYHPSNSYLYLYGNMDMDQTLDRIDREYLCKFDRRPVNSAIAFQKPFEAQRKVTMPYPVLEDEPLEDNTFLTVSYVVDNGRDVLTDIAFNVLDYVLLNSSGAVLKQALLDAGAGKSISGGYSDGILQPFFSIESKYANEEDLEKFLNTVDQTLRDLVKNGIDEASLRAALHYYEFRYREADYASYPKGLIYGMSLFDTWLYDDDRCFDNLKQLAVYDELRARIGTGYFEGLIERAFLNNPHSSVVILRPDRHMAARREEQEAARLAAFLRSLTDAQREELVRQTAELKRYQTAKDTPEDIAKLPVLRREDIDRKPPFEIRNREISTNGTLILEHDYATRGIAYLDLMFDLSQCPEELLPHMSFLKSVLAKVDTKSHSYRALSDEIDSCTGGLEPAVKTFETPEGFRAFFVIRTKYLYREEETAFRLIREILTSSDFSDRKRLHEITAALKAQMQTSLAAWGNVTASERALASVSSSAGWMEKTGGIDYYRFIENLYTEDDPRGNRLEEIFSRLCGIIFRPENLTVSVTAEEEGLRHLRERVEELKQSLVWENGVRDAGKSAPGAGGDRTGEEGAIPETGRDRADAAGDVSEAGRDRADAIGDVSEAGKDRADAAVKPAETFRWRERSRKEAFKTSGQVQFVATAGNFRAKGFEYTGALRVLKVLLNYEYLWTNLRELGGAYGCMSAFRRNGECYLVSFRDPHLAATLEVFARLPEFLKNFTADARTMTQYVIGAIGELDTPMTARMLGNTALALYFGKISPEDLQKERDEVLSVNPEDIRKLADLVGSALDGEHLCVLGSGSAIEKHAGLFDKIEALVTA